MEIRKKSVSDGTAANDHHTLILLDNYMFECNYESKVLSDDIVDSWVRTLKGKSKTINVKVCTVRTFVKYLNALDNPSFMPDMIRDKSDYMPYIFSNEEVERIMNIADNIITNKAYRYSPYTALKVPMVIRILYSCGTRLGETMELKRKDIDFNKDTMFIRKAKRSKERLIPVHHSLMIILEKYCLALGILDKPNEYLFPGQKPERHFTERQMLTWFSKILRICNIDQQKKEKGSRGACLHCFRHLFVLKSMQQLEAEGHSIDMNDLLLPTYLGHNGMIDTDKYMRFSGVQVPEALDAFQNYTKGLIPDVEVPYEEE